MKRTSGLSSSLPVARLPDQSLLVEDLRGARGPVASPSPPSSRQTDPVGVCALFLGL